MDDSKFSELAGSAYSEPRGRNWRCESALFVVCVCGIGDASLAVPRSCVVSSCFDRRCLRWCAARLPARISTRIRLAHLSLSRFLHVEVPPGRSSVLVHVLDSGRLGAMGWPRMRLRNLQDRCSGNLIV